jgi:hypothetical protein
MTTGECAGVEPARDVHNVGDVIVDRRTRLAGLAMAALGVTAAGAVTLGVINAGAAASRSGAAPRTVVATAGPDTPHAVGQAVTVTAQAEVPVRLDSTSIAQPQLDLRQIVYTISGNQRPDDPVTIVYADEVGALRTVENVTLPWTMTLVPNLPVNYVTANSHGSQLNCWITDASGTTVVSKTDYGTYTTCNR